jgi:hypothetical protein
MFKESAIIFLSLACVSANIVDGWDDPGPRRTQHGPTLETPQGFIRGEIEFYDGFRSHVSYKGIPYAQGHCHNFHIRNLNLNSI